MDHKVEKADIDNILLGESTCSVKEELCEEDNFEDEKAHIFETVESADSVNLIDDKGHGNNMRQYEIAPILDNIKTELSSSEFQYDVSSDNIKVEDGIIGGDIKTEYNDGLLYCENCHAHYQDYCIKCGMLLHILNKTVLSSADNKAQEQLPSDILEIQESFGQLGVFTLKVIPERVRFGPFTGISGLECILTIKGGKFVVTEDVSKHMNWMQYVNFARNTSEQNLLVLQHENNIYYESTCQILEGNELLVYFGEDYDGSLNNDFEMDFIPTIKHVIMDVFACTFCCLGFSSKAFLVKHKTICLASAAQVFSIKELMQCPSCKIHLDREEYFQHHMSYCCERNHFPPTLGARTAQENANKTHRRRIYKCEKCKYTTRYKGDLSRHANHHNKVKTYKCGICNRRFKTKGSLKRHEDNAHVYVGVKEEPEHSTGDYENPQIKGEASSSPVDLKQFKCSLCEFKTKYKPHIKRHMMSKHLKKHYECFKCGYRTVHKPDLIFHIKAKHLKEFDYKCERCDYKTNRRTHLKRHTKLVHLKRFDYNCDMCDYRTNIKGRLEIHTKTKHTKEFVYNCDLCEYGTNRRKNLEKHKKGKHLKEFAFKCESCEYSSNFKHHLQTHIKSKHLKKFDFMCDICDYKSNSKVQYKYHIKTVHLKEFDFKCPSCEYGVNRKSYLEEHIKSKHLKVFDYSCDMCDYKTNDKRYFECHTKTKHLMEFNYKCESCSYKTYIKSNLEFHMKTVHLKEFDYRCDLCDYKVNIRSNFESHMKTKHLKVFDYKCEWCTFKTNVKSKLEVHIKSKHREVD